MARILVGTSGWHYAHWKGRFYPPSLRPGDYLAYYSERFPTVEINNTFYRLPEKKTFVEWRKTVPKDFVFAVKASRFITHMKKLKDSRKSFAKFFRAVEGLEEKLGPILFQLPPRWRLNYERLEEFLSHLPASLTYAFELRDESWLVPEVFELLDRVGAAHCIYDLAGFVSPLETTGEISYVRLHGPGAKYRGSYSARALLAWRKRALGWARKRPVYLYFDNDEKAFAIENARSVREALG